MRRRVDPGSPGTFHSPTSTWIALGALCLTVIGLAYWGALSAPFVWDDHQLVGLGSPVVDGEALENPFRFAFWELGNRQETQAYYRPLAILSLAVDYRLWGDAPRGFHLTNLLLHFAVCMLVFAVARRHGAGPWSATLVLLVFGLFPRLTETVTFVSGRTDLIASIGVLGAVYLHRSEQNAHLQRVAAAVMLLLGLFGKEVAIAGAGATVWLEWRRRSADADAWRRMAIQLTPLFVALALYGLARVHAGVHQDADLFPLWPSRALYPFQALGQYLWMLATPWNPQLVVGTLGVPEPLMIALGFGVAAGLAWVLWKLSFSSAPIHDSEHASNKANHAPLHERNALVILAVFAILPVLHLIPLPIRAVAADRFLYLPLAATLVFVAASAHRLSPRWTTIAACLSAVLVVSFGIGTHLRNQEWGDEEELWRVTAGQMPAANGLAEFELGNLLGGRGESELAIAHYRRSLALERELQGRHPEYPIPIGLLSNLGLVLAERGHHEEALPILEEVVRQRPNEALRHFYLASALSRSLEFARADQEFAMALQLYPDYAEAMQYRGQNLEAAKLWSRLPPMSPQEPTSLKAARAQVYFIVGRLGRANTLWTEVVNAADVEPPQLVAAQQTLTLQHRVVGITAESKALEAALHARAEAPVRSLEGIAPPAVELQ